MYQSKATKAKQRNSLQNDVTHRTCLVGSVNVPPDPDISNGSCKAINAARQTERFLTFRVHGGVCARRTSGRSDSAWGAAIGAAPAELKGELGEGAFVA